jgi:hypothetical protein
MDHDNKLVKFASAERVKTFLIDDFVTNRPEGARLTAAAAHAGVRKATASDAVSALKRKALLRKFADASDGRAVALKVTRPRLIGSRWSGRAVSRRSSQGSPEANTNPCLSWWSR